MKINFLKILVCPFCKTSLDLHCEHGLQDVVECGYLVCETCYRKYSIINHIPRFVSLNRYTDSFEYQWNLHRKTQLDSFTGLPISENRLFGVTDWPKRMTGQNILEVGSGAGRFTEILVKTGATVVSFDLSIAVEINWVNNGHFINLNLLQADIDNLPFLKASFDKILCLGVIQHTPDPKRAFEKIIQYVRPGGEVVIDVYSKKFLSLLHWKYLLRPLTKRMDIKVLYKLANLMVSQFLPLSILMRKGLGRIGSRLLPIVEYSVLGLTYEMNKQWSILDTFDMYSPAHDHPQSIATIKRWFSNADFCNVTVKFGPNGIVGKGNSPRFTKTR